VAESPELRRAEFALAAFGATAFLLSLLYLLDALRFHHHVLVDALAGLPHGDLQPRGLLLLGLAAFDLVALGRAAVSAGRVSAAHRRAAAALPVGEWRSLHGQRVCVVPSTHAAAFCVGLLRPRIVVTTAAVQRLDPEALRAVVTHESRHAARRDPLRLLAARAVGDAFAPALGRREQALSELAADAACVRTMGGAPLAAALLAFHDDAAGIAPERVDRLAGRAPLADVPRTLVIGAGVVVGLLLVLVASALVVPRPVVCLPLATAPLWTLGAVTARLAVLAPAWLGWRRAATVLKPL
jgi:Peptidase family M48